MMKQDCCSLVHVVLIQEGFKTADLVIPKKNTRMTSKPHPINAEINNVPILFAGANFCAFFKCINHVKTFIYFPNNTPRVRKVIFEQEANDIMVT